LEKKRIEEEKEWARLERVRKIQEKSALREKQRGDLYNCKKPTKGSMDKQKSVLFKKNWKEIPDVN
jgi:hypothetical protein